MPYQILPYADSIIYDEIAEKNKVFERNGKFSHIM